MTPTWSKRIPVLILAGGLTLMALLGGILFLSPDSSREEIAGGPPGDVPVGNPGTGAGTAPDPTPAPDAGPGTPLPIVERGPRLDLPDQPGWTQPPSHRDYDLDARTFALTRVRTSHLGSPVKEGGKTTVAPFLLAALPWKDSFRDEDDEVVVAEKVATLLRQHRILSCASPVVISMPTRKKDPRTWQDARKAWIGIPVPPGTALPGPLQGIPFEGAEVIEGPGGNASVHLEEDWPALVAQARALGREPSFPLLYRYTGWTSDHPDRIEVTWMLPMKPLP
ncbi:hypothetical protein KBD49_13195 [Myxococcota bacterium]|nr:hypothetical protein [Myxococcota bacterium]